MEYLIGILVLAFAMLFFLEFTRRKHLRHAKKIAVARRKMMEHLLEHLPVDQAILHLEDVKIIKRWDEVDSIYMICASALEKLDADQLARMCGMLINGGKVKHADVVDLVGRHLDWDFQKFQEFTDDASQKHKRVKAILLETWKDVFAQKEAWAQEWKIKKEVEKGKETF